MCDPGNMGRILEHKITSKLSEMHIFDRVLHEDELRKLWGWDICSIDHLLIYKNYLIPIQEKWCNTRRRETKHMQRFLKSVKYLQRVLPDKQVLFGLWVSRIDPFDDNKHMLTQANVHTVSCYTSCMDELVTILVNWLQQHLHHVHDAHTVYSKNDYL